MMKLDEICRRAAVVSVLARRCHDDVAVSVRLEDGRVLAPTTAVLDMERLHVALSQLRDLIDGDDA